MDTADKAGAYPSGAPFCSPIVDTNALAYLAILFLPAPAGGRGGGGGIRSGALTVFE
jgi:hypothetical protein